MSMEIPHSKLFVTCISHIKYWKLDAKHDPTISEKSILRYTSRSFKMNLFSNTRSKSNYNEYYSTFYVSI